MSKPEPSPFLLGRFLSAVLVAVSVWILLSRLIPMLPGLQSMLSNSQLAPYAAALSSTDMSKARALFDRDLKGNPNDPNAYWMIAQACIQAKKYDIAIEYLNKGLAMCSKASAEDRARFYMLLTTCYSESETAKPHTQAILAAKHALDLLPDSPDALNEYGYVLATNGQQLDEAVRVTSRALQLLKKEPDSPEARLTTATIEDSYGWALYGQGHFDAAANALNQAIADYPPEALPVAKIKSETLGILYYHLGAAYRKAKNMEQARQALESALRYAPDNKEAKAEMDSLKAEPAHPKTSADAVKPGPPESEAPGTAPIRKAASHSNSHTIPTAESQNQLSKPDVQPSGLDQSATEKRK